MQNQLHSLERATRACIRHCGFRANNSLEIIYPRNEQHRKRAYRQLLLSVSTTSLEKLFFFLADAKHFLLSYPYRQPLVAGATLLHPLPSIAGGFRVHAGVSSQNDGGGVLGHGDGPVVHVRQRAGPSRISARVSSTSRSSSSPSASSVFQVGVLTRDKR